MALIEIPGVYTMKNDKPLWKKPQLIILAQETVEEISLAGCKVAAKKGQSKKVAKKGCKAAGCKTPNASS